MIGAGAAAALAGLLAVADGGVQDGTPPPATASPPTTPTPPATLAAPSAGSEPASARAKARAEHAQAMIHLRAGRIEEAAELFTRAVEHDPGNSAIATDYGFSLARLGRRAEAEKVLRGAIEKDPKRFYAYVNLADLWASDPGRWERRDAAVTFLEKGLDALKDDRKGRFNLLLGLAGFERAIGRTAGARARLAPLLAPDAPPLSRAQRKRVLDLADAIALDERAHALEDWPVPAIAPADQARLEEAERTGSERPTEALPGLDALVRAVPGWARARIARAAALEGAGRVDEAVRELEIATNLAPSNARAWRALGRLLAVHGGALELDRADEALKQALTLEPAWSDLRELRARIARRRAAGSPPAPAPAGAGPSERARALYQEAEEWIDLGDPAGFGRDRLEEALADSPGFVAAAVSMYALTGAVPKATSDALANDGPGLWALASGVRKLGKPSTGPADATDAETKAWIDRAVELDVQEARFSRAVSRAAGGERQGALEDLTAYVAREPNPERLAEAQALRAGLGGGAGPRGETRPSPTLLARIRLLEDRPDAALRALGGTCTAELAPDRLIAIGLVQEYADRRSAARACYELGGDPALARLARLDARLPDAELRAADRRPLARAAARGIPAAEWALARFATLDGDDASALARTERALALGAPSATEADVWLPEARAAEQRMADARRRDARAREVRRRRAKLGALAFAAVGSMVLARWRWRGHTVAAALRRRPGLYPEVGRSVGELRHDVLKHRAGLLGLVADPDADRVEIARALTEPRPTSIVTAAIYERLAAAARGAGATLRPLGREPVFGAIARDLARAETLLPRAKRAEDRTELLAIDERLRGVHADALSDLLHLGPRTRLDAAALSSWISAVEAAARRSGGAWTATALALADLDVDFPVENDALEAIFANLLRNAQTAVAGQPDPRVVVRVDRERDVTGRQAVTLYVGDSAAEPLTLEAIDARESGRGLAIVRDLVRQWRGHLLVRPEPAPFTKVVGASFPL